MLNFPDGDTDEDSVAAGEVEVALGDDESLGTLKPLPLQPLCEASGVEFGDADAIGSAFRGLKL